MKNFKVSLRTKIIGLVLGILTVVGFGAWWNEAYLARHYKESIIQSYSAVSHAGVKGITDQFSRLYNNVQSFALNSQIASGKAEHIPHLFNEYVKLYGVYDLILVIDKQGRYVASNTKDFGGKNVDTSSLASKSYLKEPWFQAAMNGEFTENKDKGFKGTFVEAWMYDPLMKTAFNEERLGSSFTAPIKDDNGNVLGVITSRASSRWIKDIFSGLSTSLDEINSDGNIVMVDSRGILLFAQDAEGQPKLADDFLKKNLAADNPIIKKALTGKAGSETGWSNVLKAESVSSYSSFEDEKWIDSIGWHLIIEDHYEDLLAPEIQAERNFYVIFGSTLFIALAVSIWFAVVLTKQVTMVTTNLAHNSGEVSRESTSLAASATELSESSTEQAAALQETVAAVDEIFAMVEKNADAATRSQQYSNQSREAAQQGKTIVENMLTAIAEIDSANKQVSERMDVSNKELNNITNLIKEIGSKTKVINDIVFQTKLLSFNASVEAARAGEYGKGFAVVAEEVGNLAQMSGTAAKEISGLLDESVKKVETIVNDSKKQVEKLMLMNKEKVDAGSQTAHECASALEDILQNVSHVDSMVSEIAVASKEQSLGIKEISKAVGQMEQVIQQNTAVAQMSSSSSEKLRSQAEGLQSIVSELQYIVNGESSDKADLKVVNSDRDTSNENLVSFKRKAKDSSPSVKLEVSSKPETKKHEKAESSIALNSIKIAAGGDFVPSSDDPGFDD